MHTRFCSARDTNAPGSASLPKSDRFYGLRICNVRGPDRETPADYAEHLVDEGLDPDSDEFEHRIRRKQAMWHSRRDLAQLVDRCLRDESVAADVFYGVSDNAT